MKFTTIENTSIAIAIIFFGIMAGFFWTYTFNVNIAMLTVDGETYARMQSLFNQNVRHPMFFTFFFGAGVISFLSTAINYKYIKDKSFWLLLMAALTYIAGVIFFTAQVNLPLNYYTESWNPSALPDDWATIRETWNQANAIRVGTSCTSFLLCVIALLTRCR